MLRMLAPGLIALGVNIMIAMVVWFFAAKFGRALGTTASEVTYSITMFHTIVKYELEFRMAIHAGNAQAATILLNRIRDLKPTLPPQPTRPRAPGGARVAQR